MSIVVNLKDLKTDGSGLILAEPIFNQFGQMLLASGTELQARHLTVLKTWGCKAVTIQDGQQEEKEPEISPELQERALNRVQWRMKWEPVSDLEKEIHQMAVKQVVRRLLGQ